MNQVFFLKMLKVNNYFIENQIRCYVNNHGNVASHRIKAQYTWGWAGAEWKRMSSFLIGAAF